MHVFIDLYKLLDDRKGYPMEDIEEVRLAPGMGALQLRFGLADGRTMGVADAYYALGTLGDEDIAELKRGEAFYPAFRRNWGLAAWVDHEYLYEYKGTGTLEFGDRSIGSIFTMTYEEDGNYHTILGRGAWFVELLILAEKTPDYLLLEKHSVLNLANAPSLPMLVDLGEDDPEDSIYFWEKRKIFKLLLPK